MVSNGCPTVTPQIPPKVPEARSLSQLEDESGKDSDSLVSIVLGDGGEGGEEERGGDDDEAIFLDSLGALIQSIFSFHLKLF
tara:strand:- start:198 stop:443 length:246 start_codon:yes stop_codon:yes gene_type:complete